ncbi:MAG: hypothetical protein FWD25_07845 [Clostridia bacterium]|nr:hypothetical protein [Clostridia bacterium]
MRNLIGIIMRWLIDLLLVVICALTIVNTNYQLFSLMDGVIFGCIGLAIVAAIVLRITTQKKKEKA